MPLEDGGERKEETWKDDPSSERSYYNKNAAMVTTTPVLSSSSSSSRLQPFGPNIWYVDGPHVSFYGFDYPTRMVVVKLSGESGVWLWSPIAYSRELGAEIESQCGSSSVQYIVSPNYIHHLFLKEWCTAYPHAKLHGPPGLAERKVAHDLTLDTVLTDDVSFLDIDLVIFRGSIMDEVVFYHRLSETIIFGDLIQRHDPETCKGCKGWLMRLDDLVGPTGSTPREWRWNFWWTGKKELARTALRKVVEEWKPKQLLIAHGECAREGATEIVQQALSWI